MQVTKVDGRERARRCPALGLPTMTRLTMWRETLRWSLRAFSSAGRADVRTMAELLDAIEAATAAYVEDLRAFDSLLTARLCATDPGAPTDFGFRLAREAHDLAARDRAFDGIESRQREGTTLRHFDVASMRAVLVSLQADRRDLHEATNAILAYEPPLEVHVVDGDEHLGCCPASPNG